MQIRTLALSAVVLFASACTATADGSRRELVELRCSTTECEARWDDSPAWSRVVAADDLVALTEVDQADVWECEREPDVDLCVVVDGHGRVGCFRVEGDFAVAVGPACAVSGAEWLDVGNAMVAKVTE